MVANTHSFNQTKKKRKAQATTKYQPNLCEVMSFFKKQNFLIPTHSLEIIIFFHPNYVTWFTQHTQTQHSLKFQ
jgi:hypothetical protein